MIPGRIADAVEPVKFLIGRWKSVRAGGKYVDRVSPFEYVEELSFTSYGQPLLNYKSETWHLVSKQPMHLESGFLRIKPGSKQVAFFVAHNFGITSVEEGTVEENTIRLKSTAINRSCCNPRDPKVTGIERTFKLLDDGRLEIRTSMSTSVTPEMSEHLAVLYEKC